MSVASISGAAASYSLRKNSRNSSTVGMAATCASRSIAPAASVTTPVFATATAGRLAGDDLPRARRKVQVADLGLHSEAGGGPGAVPHHRVWLAGLLAMAALGDSTCDLGRI